MATQANTHTLPRPRTPADTAALPAFTITIHSYHQAATQDRTVMGIWFCAAWGTGVYVDTRVDSRLLTQMASDRNDYGFGRLLSLASRENCDFHCTTPA